MRMLPSQTPAPIWAIQNEWTEMAASVTSLIRYDVRFSVAGRSTRRHTQPESVDLGW